MITHEMLVAEVRQREREARAMALRQQAQAQRERRGLRIELRLPPLPRFPRPWQRPAHAHWARPSR
jgi:hypothetical protein